MVDDEGVTLLWVMVWLYVGLVGLIGAGLIVAVVNSHLDRWWGRRSLSPAVDIS